MDDNIKAYSVSVSMTGKDKRAEFFKKAALWLSDNCNDVKVDPEKLTAAEDFVEFRKVSKKSDALMAVWYLVKYFDCDAE